MRFRKRADGWNSTAGPLKPYVLPPSGKFDGNDGKWSSFNINLGDSDGTGSGENFRVLISTSSPLTIVPGLSGWCSQDCSAQRGVQIFNNNQPSGFDKTTSKSWEDAGTYGIPLPDWWSMGDIDALYGTENVGLGETSAQSPILPAQYVAINTNESLFMGSFGLANGAIKAGQGSKQTFLSNLNDTGLKIPSLSYGYTAGAFYQRSGRGVQGSLVLGGYDKSRLKPGSNITISMPNDKDTSLIVGVPSILYSPDQNVEQTTSSLTGTGPGFLATIDSTLPYFWLPEDIVNRFVDKFQLKYDSKTDLYFVNSTAHSHNQQQNATVSFKISKDSADGNPSTSIVLPYAAFYLEANYPLTDNTTYFFPIKIARNKEYVLGRTFLQHAYLIVDYERSDFTVAPAVYSDPMPDQSLVTIYSKDYSPAKPPLIPTSGNKGLSPGAVAGIVVGVLLVFLLVAVGAFFRWKKHRKNQPAPAYTEKPAEIDTVVAGTEVKHRRVSELDSGPNSAYGSPKPSAGGFYGGDRDNKDLSPFPTISEMESPPAELYSPPMGSATPYNEGAGGDYFIAGGKVRRRGATRESSEANTPGTPTALAELPGDDGQYQVGGVHFDHVPSPKLSHAQHARGPSDTSLHSKIDDVVARSREASQDRSATPLADVKEGGSQNALGKVREEGEEAALSTERRPSHTRGLSDTTVQSDDTAVSALTPEEMEQWRNDEPRRPMSE